MNSFEAELHYNRVFNKHHHVGSVLKYNQDSKIRTYNLGSDLKNSVPVRHQGFSGRSPITGNIVTLLISTSVIRDPKTLL